MAPPGANTVGMTVLVPKSKARIQKTNRVEPDPNSYREAGSDGREVQVESIGAGRENSQGSNSINQPRRTIAGGILRQLIEENDDQLAYHSQQIEKLRHRRQQLDDLFNELIEKEARPFPSSNGNNEAPPQDSAEGQN